MTDYLLDTNHVSYLQQQHPRVIARLNTLRSGDRVMTSVVSVAELLQGVYALPRGKRRRELLALYHRVMNELAAVLPITRVEGERFARIGARLRRKGRPMPVNDIWIAAIALVHGAVLVTNDAHFQHVPGLKTENWTAG